MKYIRYIAAESLRMYPEPPLLIRRALEDDELPPGSGGPDGFRPKITRGVDLFLAIYNLHRSHDLWENPDTFDPDRFDRPFENKGVHGWAGFDPSLTRGQLYPNEVTSDFAFLPFGGERVFVCGDMQQIRNACLPRNPCMAIACTLFISHQSLRVCERF